MAFTFHLSVLKSDQGAPRAAHDRGFRWPLPSDLCAKRTAVADDKGDVSLVRRAFRSLDWLGLSLCVLFSKSLRATGAPGLPLV